MTANVYRDAQAAASIMALEYKNVASTIIVPMMQRSGIRRLEVKRIVVASDVRMVPLGIAIINIEASKEEIDSLMATYAKLDELSNGSEAEQVESQGIELTGDVVKKAAEMADDAGGKKACSAKRCSCRKPRRTT